MQMNSLEHRWSVMKIKAERVYKAEYDYEQSIKDAGSELIELKKITPHGQWLPWLKEAGIAERTARHWMQEVREPGTVAKVREANRTREAANRQHVAGFPSTSDGYDDDPDPSQIKTTELSPNLWGSNMASSVRRMLRQTVDLHCPPEQAVAAFVRELGPELTEEFVQIIEEVS